MNEPDFATVALYFRFGLEASVLTEAQVRDWALEIVDSFNMPPSEVVELLASRGTANLHANLKDIASGNGNLQLAGRWLLWDLLHLLTTTLEVDAHRTISRQAVQIARSTEQSEDLQLTFSRLDATLDIFEMGYGGGPDGGRDEFRDVLAQLAVRPELRPHSRGVSV
ncbi:hypothetical protein J2X19_000083 [Rhodoferax ferrireducens]|uniref:Uncharacterized protein n=1 Tax=Rhodoferax ferrireducens TaxID=192843 RepID=A0ABU2C284_9BURK|nr:hypothetical protein [Rhodoferax ferrireducens]MDR7375425.1 hypothetical protein [Rhodoferax ferrireducens]